MSTPYATAPRAPGTLGADVAPEDLLSFLTALGAWRDQRKRELDALDEAALGAPGRDTLTPDVLLSMTLWKAVAERHDLLLATWDSGRVGPVERRRLTTLIWGRLEQGSGSGDALAVSLPEACRLSDSLAAALRGRLGLDFAAPDAPARVGEVRATVERIRDQIALIPSQHRSSAEATLASLDARLDDVAARVRRGADVGGFLPALESAVATTERDLIVAASARAQARSAHEHALGVRAELEARGNAVRALATSALAEVSPAPRLGIPDVDALGPVPTEPADLAGYRARLERVGAALTQAHAAYAAALEHRDDVLARMDAVAARGAQAGEPAAGDIGAMLAPAAAIVGRRPVDVARLDALTAAAEAYLGRIRPATPKGRPA